MRTILLAGTCCAGLSGCVTAAAGLALSAASLVTGGNSGKGGDGFPRGFPLFPTLNASSPNYRFLRFAPEK